MKYYRYISLGLIALSLFACQETPALKGFDQKAWKEDKLGCKNVREKFIPLLLENKDKLIGLGQNQILSLLGRPDFSELYQRGQRYYIYYYAEDKPCRKETPEIHRDKVLKVRFSALDAVTEIVINN
jgi:hypothetical protein